MPTVTIDDKPFEAEVDQAITEAMAVLEARRCLRCDLQTAGAKRELAQLQQE